MNAISSLAPKENLDSVMLTVARDIAQDIYELPDILRNNDVTMDQFMRWKDHPTFLRYIQSEREAWNSAGNAAERTKVKAAVVLETFLERAHTDLHNSGIALNQRVELLKVMTNLAGFNKQNIVAGGPGGGTGGFRLQINIAAPQPGAVPHTINIDAQPVPPDNADFDDYDPFTSPSTLED